MTENADFRRASGHVVLVLRIVSAEVVLGVGNTGICSASAKRNRYDGKQLGRQTRQAPPSFGVFKHRVTPDPWLVEDVRARGPPGANHALTMPE